MTTKHKHRFIFTGVAETDEHLVIESRCGDCGLGESSVFDLPKRRPGIAGVIEDLGARLQWRNALQLFYASKIEWTRRRKSA